jgi:hypothetical protein
VKGNEIDERMIIVMDASSGSITLSFAIWTERLIGFTRIRSTIEHPYVTIFLCIGTTYVSMPIWPTLKLSNRGLLTY